MDSACHTAEGFLPDADGGMYYLISGGLSVYLDRSRNLSMWEPVSSLFLYVSKNNALRGGWV
jgi:hypothetical protein